MARHGDRDPARERYWRQILSAWRASGLSVRAFCDRRDLTETAFYFWRNELRKRDGERASKLAFVPVSVVPAPTTAVEVRCPSGHVVSVPGCDASLLRAVFAALAPVPPC
jgi:hypothetical protein